MIQKGYLVKKENKYLLTETGKQRLHTLLVQTGYYARSKKKWDGKWRMVTYDIPEKYKQKRDILRSRLMQAGFVKVQGSVWVYPYQCNEIVALIKFEIKLGRHALYMIVDAIEGDEELRKRFGLPINSSGGK
jgi:DNA-binding transcriptional regulator PaaX